MKTFNKIKFPCGYQYEQTFNSYIFFGIISNEKELPVCPLHGKQCKAK